MNDKLKVESMTPVIHIDQFNKCINDLQSIGYSETKVRMIYDIRKQFSQNKVESSKE